MKTIIVIPGWSLCIHIMVYKMVLEAHILLKRKMYLYGNTDIYTERKM